MRNLICVSVTDREKQAKALPKNDQNMVLFLIKSKYLQYKINTIK